MRKILLATSAMVAAGSFAASAVAAEAPTVSMSGAMHWEYAVTGDDANANDDGNGQSLDLGNSASQLIWDVNAVADNGLEYGARIDWRYGNGASDIDEAYLSFAGNWGTLHVGEDDFTIDNQVPGGESVLVGAWGFDGTNGLYGAHVGSAASTNTFATLAVSSSDAAKFAYYSPSFAGFQVSGSYAPEGDTDENHTWDVALAYNNTFGEVDFGAGIGYGAANGPDSQEDSEGLMAGAKVSIAGFSAGVGYGDNFDTGVAEGVDGDGGQWWNVGLAYNFGPGAVSLGYMDTERDTAGGEDELWQIHLDAEYTVAEGLVTFAGYQHGESEDASANTDYESDTILIGTRLSF